MHKIGINGFGRIGRTFFRHYLERAPKTYEVVAIKDIVPIEQLAYLLKYDSAYGVLQNEIKIDSEKSELIIDGKRYTYFKHGSALDVSWKNLRIDLLVGATDHDLQNEQDARKLATRDNLKILFSTRRAWCDANLIYKVNHQDYDPQKHVLLTSGSCTGNALIPIIKIIHDAFTIEEGSLISIHSALTDQRVVDTYQSKNPALGRSASESLITIPTEMANSVIDIFPELKGKLAALTYRIPIISMTILNASFVLGRKTTVAGLNETIKKAAEGHYKGVVLYDDNSTSFGFQKVSIDYLKQDHSSIFMANQSLVTQAGRFINISLMHDNEWGYVKRLHDVLEHVVLKN